MTAGVQRPGLFARLRGRDFAVPSPGRSGLALALCTIVMLVYPLVVQEYTVLVSISFLTFAMLTVSQVYVWGFGGIFSFAQAAFYALGSYAYAVIAGNIGGTAGAVVGLVTAPLVVLVLAALLGFFLFHGRMGAFLVGIVTLSFSLMLGTFLNQTGGPNYHIGKVLLGGYNGINDVAPLLIGGVPASTEVLYYLAAAVLLAGTAAVALVRFSRIGYSIRAVAENPVRAELFGHNVLACRIGVFATGAAFAAAGGELYALWGSYTSPSLVTLQSITLPVVVAVVAGRSRAIAAMLAAVVYAAVSQNLASNGAAEALIVLGVGLIVVMLVAPGGVGGWLAAQAGRVVARRGAAAAAAAPEAADPADPARPVESGSITGGRS